MGMAASQARLLTITARLADNELRSQTINNAKMRLATQSSQASENYVNALNNATLKFSNYDSTGAALTQDLTYNALTAYSSYNTQYGLVNSSGQILVSEEEAAMYAQSNGNLNAYLQKHGLEYTTTYFDELGDMKNEAYPEPFNIIDAETMKSYYENYNSYENSIEVERYNNNYTAYANAYTNLSKAAQDSMKDYLMYSGNQTKISYDAANKSYSISLNSSTMDGILTELKNAFTSGNNTYNVNTLFSKGFISEDLKDTVIDYLNLYQYVSNEQVYNADGSSTSVTGIKYTNNCEISEPTADGENKVYTLDGDIKVTVDVNGNVIAIDDSKAIANNSDTSSTFVLNYPKNSDGTIKTGMTLSDFVNKMSYTITDTDASGNVSSFSYYYNMVQGADGKNTLTSSTYYTDFNEVKNELIPSLVKSVITTISDAANYENFADFLISQDPSTLNQYGINIADPIKGLDKTLEEVLQDYIDAKDSFLDNIFSTSDRDLSDPASLTSKDIVEDDLKNGYTFTNDEGVSVTVTAENLTDLDFVLQYLKDSQTRAANGAIAHPIVQSESFNTVIKEYIVDLMIEQTGEPKYAWVDSNDTSNKGNADAKAQWYTNLFNRMKEGYKAIENGLASSKEWIEYALESGIVTLEQVDKSFRWNNLDYKSCTRITEETDQEAVTKAEAEYNRAMNDIEAKDNIYDIELKNIDTEHTSLQTEYESIKGVITKNIERTFKFNQSA